MLSLLEMNDLLFPPSFLFGAATAGYQIEGNNINSNIYHDEIRFPKNYPQRSAACCNSISRRRFSERTKSSISGKSIAD